MFLYSIMTGFLQASGHSGSIKKCIRGATFVQKSLQTIESIKQIILYTVNFFLSLITYTQNDLTWAIYIDELVSVKQLFRRKELPTVLKYVNFLLFMYIIFFIFAGSGFTTLQFSQTKI